MKKILLLVCVVMTVNTFSQINSPNGDNFFYYNGAADVTFRYLPRGNGGRAFVHADNNVLALNFLGDFTGGTLIGNNVYFKDGGNSYISSGNLGIGTFNPAVKLDVISDDVAAFFRSSLNTVPVSIINTGNPISTIGFKGSNSTNEYNVRVGANGESFIAYTSNTERMRIDSNGNVGIGTVNPQSSLDVNGYLTTFGGPNSSDSFFSWGSGNGSWDIRPNDTNGKPYIIQNHTGLTFNAHSFYGGIRFYNQGYPSLYNSTLVMSVVNDRVGIGVINPDEKLTVKGKIHTQEVRVDMSGPLVPDYVFANDYKLKSLQEVENYIKQNNHLPEIPSSQEIEKNGLMLAEMNMNLLKKIEELTLYMIEIKKENEKQNEEIKNLKRKLEN
ncbi:tail fiber protein [Flavobacterium seoulense]|uniref:Peptidase S74 domain-containing protein n=1 Tax=Flavobacterium seoulense TaxID=1492738 RepID=A0A066WL13_9FLAO|nr:tail fiber protein [Flavobacterium seoulense]KDN54707.1 hypothetical protein FEM21_22210 [Flavobacterium seoulense]